MKEHILKTWPEYFERVKSGQKKFELRKNDRDFQVGDILALDLFDPKDNTYMGEIIRATVDYVLHGPAFGIKRGYCVMSISIIDD